MIALAFCAVSVARATLPELPGNAAFAPYYEELYTPTGKLAQRIEWRVIDGGRRWQHTIRDARGNVLKRFVFEIPQPKKP
jgi:hypothetical protein